MKILFVCKYNAFRSRVAEKYFNKINKNKSIKVESAGIIMGSSVDPPQRNAAKRLLKVDIKGGPKPLNHKELKSKKYDIIIITANDVPEIVFNYYKELCSVKILSWKIPDVWDGDDMKGNEKTILIIKSKIEELVKNLEK